MVRRTFGVVILGISALLVLFLPLHLLALARVWGTPQLPAEWIANLGIALALAAFGVLGVRLGVRLLRRPAALRTPVARFSH